MLTRLFCLILTAAVVTQAQMAVIPGQAVNPASRARLVTLDMRNVPVKQVLDAIAQQAGARTLYSSGVVKLDTKVSVNVANATVDQAIAAAVRGTALEAKLTPGGETIMVGRRAGGKVARAAGVIAGRVSDGKTGKGISGASVSINVQDRGVTTGEDGSYRLTGVSAGNHTVTARLLGYAKQTRQVTVSEGATVNADFRLEPSASVLDQVIVTGSVAAVERRAVPNAMTVVTAKDIQEKGITSIDQLFRGEVPGVFVKNSVGGSALNGVGSSQMNVRGVSNLANNPASGNIVSPIKTYVDGIELANPALLNTIDPKSIERIEVLTGPQASTIYGSGAINGVMQVFTKKGSGSAKPQLTLSLQSGIVESNVSSGFTPQHDFSGQLSGGGQGTSYSLGGGYAFLGAYFPGALTRTFSGYGSVRREEGLVTAEASARLSRRKVRLGYGAGGQISEYSGVESGQYIVSQIQNYLVPQNRPTTVRASTLGLVVNGNVLPWWQQRVAIGRDEVVNQLISEGPGSGYAFPSDTSVFVQVSPTQKMTASYNTTLSGSFSSALSGTLTAGIDYMGYESVRGTLFQGIAPVGNLTAGSAMTRNVEANRGYYAQSQLSANDMFFLTAGLRLENNSNYGTDYGVNVSPRFGASFVREIGSVTTKLRAAYGIATRAPQPGQREVIYITNTTAGTYIRQFANPDLAPERQHGGEGGVELFFGNFGSLQLTVYNQTVDDAIVSTVVDSVAPLPGITAIYEQQVKNLNVGTIRNRGLEGQGEIKIWKDLSLGGTWSYTRSRVQSLSPSYSCVQRLTGAVSICFFAGQALYNFAEHTGNMRLRYSAARSTVTASMTFIGQRLKSNAIGYIPFPSFARLPVYIPLVAKSTNVPLADPGYHTIDVQAMHQVTRRAQMFVRAVNLANSYNSDTDSNVKWPLLGRQILLGSNLSF